MALTLLATNNAESVLASAISATDTSLIVSAGTGAEFPDAVAGESYFKLTITDAATGSQVEIVNVTAKAGDIFTIERAQEGTLARAWAANDMVANMMTADTLNVIADFANQAASSAEEAQGYALSAAEFGDNKLTFADTTAGLAGTTSGQYFRVPQGEDSEIAFIYYRNISGVATIVATTPSEKLISNSIGHDEDSSLIKTVTPDNEVTSLQTESGEIFIAGMSESIQEMASRSGKDNTTNLHSATDKDGLQLIITDAEGKIRIPLTDFPLQDLLAQVHPVPGPFLNTLSSADKAAYGYIDELGGLNLPGLPTSVNNMLNGLSRRVQQQADGRFLTSIKDYGWDPNSHEDARQVIQRAIRDMARNPYGGVIYLPPGVYRLSSFLTPAPNVSIIGAGTGKTILMPYGSYSALQFTTSPTNPVPELTDFVYSDFEVDCQDQVLPDEGYLPRTKGLYFNFYRRGHLHRLRVRNSGATGIGIDFARDSAITECLVENFGRLAPSGNDNPAGASGLGLGAGGTQSEPLYVAGNFCRNGKNFGIFLEKQHGTNAPYSSEHTIIMGNTCTGNNGGMGDCGVDGMIMIGNNFSENNYGVVISPGTVLAYPGSRGRLQGNIIAKNAKHGVYYNSTTEQRDGEYQIDGNTIRDNGEDGINFKAPGQEVRSMFIQGNDVYRNGRHGFHLEDGTAINMDVVNNRFWNNGLTASGNGINLASEVRMSSFSGNKIRDIQAIPTQQYPVKAAGALTDVDISFNHCVGNAQNTLNLTGVQTRVTTLNNPGI
ncbi:right-handed parallel beta-helix repeat-containing protein [Klebsiella grimontii]|uniref:right-handed parallel beta-helix repeat-containing protein n=1 Tax=Klebsiella grimontii TaxID=2058152 RepID=UPI0020C4C421|nr:right-handed parallel beta-helix repeat-containing protein [Klebsiella grimontii]UTJ44333.1 right-handed parallel beta-helix repeat-containing protein [Klebsiella grimontii]